MTYPEMLAQAADKLTTLGMLLDGTYMHRAFSEQGSYVYTLKSRPSVSGFQRGISQASAKYPRSSVLQIRSAVQGHPM